MKRILLILSFLFLVLWVACLFYPNRTMGIHIALLVALLFFIRSLLVAPSPVIKEEARNNNVINQPAKNQGYNDYSMDSAKTTIKQMRPELDKQDIKVLS